MAGSYNHIVTRKGNLRSNESFIDMIENLGDSYEMAEEMYGMIWWLAYRRVASDVPPEMIQSLAFYRETIKDIVETARQNYKEGLTISKEIHRLSPDQRRD